MKIVSLIPARGGSKGIPRKNLYPLSGKPLISYSIRSSLLSKVNETWVSTDDDEISQMSANIGSKVIQRPLELAQDNSSIEDVIFHFVNLVECDFVILIQPTSPMTISEDLDRCIEKYFKDGCDSVFSAVKSNDMLIWNEQLKPMNYDVANRGNRQNRNNYTYVETGAFYMFSVFNFLSCKNRIHGKIGIVEVPFWRSFEVDCQEDVVNISRLIN